jgi:hypothetical protein
MVDARRREVKAFAARRRLAQARCLKGACMASPEPDRLRPQNRPKRVSDMERAYLDAFDAHLKAHVTERDIAFTAIWRREALRDLLAERGLDPDRFLAEVPLLPRGQQNTPRSKTKRNGRHILSATAHCPKGGRPA